PRPQPRRDGVLIVNGPLDEQSDIAMRGLSVFACDLDEARRLSDADPSVQAGRLTYDVFEWGGGGGRAGVPGGHAGVPAARRTCRRAPIDGRRLSDPAGTIRGERAASPSASGAPKGIQAPARCLMMTRSCGTWRDDGGIRASGN